MSAKLRANRFSGSFADGAVRDSFYFPSYSAAADEAEVVGILFGLPDLIRKSESTHRFPPSWGAKRRRSFIDAPPELLPVNGKLEYASSSPTSPLTFSSHTDLDMKHVVSSQQSAPSEYKGEEKEWLKNCGRAIECRAHLTRVNEAVSCISDSVEVQFFRHSQPLVHHVEFVQEMGPKGIPDLNMPVEDYGGEMEWPLQHHYNFAAMVESKAEAAALARQRRHLIQKSKRATRGAR